MRLNHMLIFIKDKSIFTTSCQFSFPSCFIIRHVSQRLILVKFHGARKPEVKMTWGNILSDCVNSQYSQKMSSEEVKPRRRHEFILSVYLTCRI